MHPHHWQRLPENCKLHMGLFWKNRQFLASPRNSYPQMIFPTMFLIPKQSLRTMRALLNLNYSSLKAGAMFSLQALANRDWGFQPPTRCCTWREGHFFLQMGGLKVGSSSLLPLTGRRLDNLHNFCTSSSLSHSTKLIIPLGTKKLSPSSPPQDKPDLHTQHASL